MRKIGLFAVAAALLLVGVGGWMEWVAPSSQARLAPAGDPIDPMQIMTNARNLPIEKFVDLSLEFH
jgi:hypothetical protein